MMRRPMLAGKCDFTKLAYPLIGSPKLDGIRAINVNGVMLSRTLKPIPNKFVQTFFGKCSPHGSDGELIVGPPTAKDCYTRTVSEVMTTNSTVEPDYYVFDNYQHVGLYTERLSSIPDVWRHKSEWLHSKQDVLDYETFLLGVGYEGVILRDPYAPYKQGRSTAIEGGMLKLKRFLDSEAIILALEELQRNDNEGTMSPTGYLTHSSHKAGLTPMGCLGSFFVRDIVTGVEFSIGTGFTQQQREEYFTPALVGKLVKYKYFPVGVKDAPRFPVFLGLRDIQDL